MNSHHRRDALVCSGDCGHVEIDAIHTWLEKLPPDWSRGREGEPNLAHFSAEHQHWYGDASNIDSPPSKRRRLIYAREGDGDGNIQVMSTSEDAESIASRSSILFNTLPTRPILQPTPPSSKRNRSPSPSRKIRSALERSKPTITFYAPSAIVPPESVARLKKVLARHAKGYIPKGLEDHLLRTVPGEYEDLEATDFDTETAPREALWAQVSDIFTQAERCQRLQMDENEWVEICRSVFRAAGITANNSRVRVLSVQTQQIDPSLLPVILNSQTSFAKKADLALAISPHHPETQPFLDNFFRKNPTSTLSHLTDAYASTVPILCGVEVKSASGNSTEAATQLGVWSAAALTKCKTFVNMRKSNTSLSQGQETEEEMILPFIGWTVVGHTWSLYISWASGDEAGNVVVLGPWSVLEAGTGSYQQIFKLLGLIKAVINWLEEKAWDWLKREVLSREEDIN